MRLLFFWLKYSKSSANHEILINNDKGEEPNHVCSSPPDIQCISYKGYIKVDRVSSVFCFIWGWEEPVWGIPFQFHGAFIMDLYVLISMKGPWYASVIWTQKRSVLKPTTALVRSRSLMNSSMICFIASNLNSYSQFNYDADIRSIVLFLVPCPHCSVCSRV